MDGNGSNHGFITCMKECFRSDMKSEDSLGGSLILRSADLESTELGSIKRMHGFCSDARDGGRCFTLTEEDSVRRDLKSAANGEWDGTEIWCVLAAGFWF